MMSITPLNRFTSRRAASAIFGSPVMVDTVSVKCYLMPTDIRLINNINRDSELTLQKLKLDILSINRRGIK
jgi:hypothetical protein